MISDTNRLLNEVSIFADVGTGAPTAEETERFLTIGIVRHGKSVRLRFDKKSGAVKESIGDVDEVRHASYRALLASEGFANLRALAGAQCQLLQGTMREGEMLPVAGFLAVEGSQEDAGLEVIERFLGEGDGAQKGVRVLLIDGPAGVGKTYLIERLVLRRAREAMRTQNPLILHVKSRGRVLTFLQDLMAFSLQTMRSSITYDQVPILVRHGLLQLAIDGFDELGDPNGYDNAWGQLRDLVEEVDGQGALLLAGRETFIGRERLLKAIPGLNDPRHTIGVLSLQSVKPNAARHWLMDKGWNEDRVASAEEWGLFEYGSYALRPFFLSRLSEVGDAQDEFLSDPPLILLVESMIDREASKFGDRVEASLDESERRRLVFYILCEAARDIAENQAESIDEESLLWIVDLALGDGFDEEISRLIKNRVLALAFLVNDDRRGRRRFAHTEFFNYFLSHSAIEAISKEEIPKFVRRTIFGADFLLSFGVVIESIDKAKSEVFLRSCESLIKGAYNLDRSSRNIGSLIFASMPVVNIDNGSVFSDFDVDDAVVRGKAQNVRLSNITVNQLDLREADVSDVGFDNVAVATLIADETTHLSVTFPQVGWVQLVTSAQEEKALFGADAVEWIDRHGRRPAAGKDVLVPDDVRGHGLFELMQRACRVMLRHHWIRSPGDDRIALLVQDRWWHVLESLLHSRELLVMEDSKQVGGRPSIFYHIKHAREILAETKDKPEVRAFLSDIVDHIHRDMRSY